MFILGVSLIIYSNIINIYNIKSINIAYDDLKDVLGNAHFFLLNDKAPKHYDAFLTDKKNNKLGVGFLTSDIAPKTKRVFR